MCANLLDCIAMARDVVTIFAALVAAIVAIAGLRTWRKQLRGRTEYELARRLLRSVYKIRDAIRIVRNPFVSSAETAEAIREAEIEVSDPLSPQGTALTQGAVYRRRWQRIQDAFAELDVDALEAEAIWGSRIPEHLKPLRSATSVLFGSVQWYLCNIANPPRHQDAESVQRMEEILYAAGEDDKFIKTVLEAVEGSERCLKRYLRL